MQTMTEQTAIELLTTMKSVEKLLKEQRKKEDKPLWVKVGELQKFTMWNNGQAYEKARDLGWVEYRIEKGCLVYNLNSVPMQFRKAPKN